LFRTVEKRLLDSLAVADKPQRAELLKLLPTFYEAAHRGEVEGTSEALRAAMPAVIAACRLPTADVETLLLAIAKTTRTVAGSADAIELLVTWLEHRPDWLRLENHQGRWPPLGHELAALRKAAKDLPVEIEDRLLRVVVAALREMLEGRRASLEALYDKDNDFWSEQQGAFVKTANQVAADHPDSLNTIKAVAAYFSGGLHDDARAIEILEAAHGRKLLDDAGLTTLARLLQDHARWAESISPLEQLLADTPDALDPRLRLLTAYFHTPAPGRIGPLLAETDTRFRRDQRWGEQTAAALGHTCVLIEHYRQAVGYCREAIALIERSDERADWDDRTGTLSSEYQDLAKALAGLGQTAAAVDAAAAGIVVWPAGEYERETALETLQQVLAKAADLDQFVAQLDREAAAAGQDKPIVRRALGEVYRQRGD
ncbi:MAG TPA: hypothetical protein VIK18_14755, partial [Pirellulales bacterium]